MKKWKQKKIFEIKKRNKLDIEESGRQSGGTGTKMGQRSYRSNGQKL